MKLFARLIATSLGGALAAAGLAWAAMQARARRALPPLSGSLCLPGLSGPVEVLRDPWGVPHIYARSLEDLFFAQGVVHAHDRLWQMDFGRRLGAGRLAEILGPPALEADRFVRTIGVSQPASAVAALLNEQERRVAERYIAGINAVVASLRPGQLPLEYALLRIRPQPWSVEHSALFGNVLALAMAGNWETEVLRAMMIARLGPQRAAALEPHYPEQHPLTIPLLQVAGTLGQTAMQQAAALQPFLGRGGEGGSAAIGSNAWAIAGSRSPTGGPLLAGDPHLSLLLPCIWYENHLCADGYHVTGASLPGIPGVIIGHNADIAWSVTNAGCDVQDLYIERFEPGSLRYATPEGWAEAQVRREEIKVRGRRRPEVLEILQTRHGPIIGRIQPAARRPPGEPAVRAGAVTLTPAELGLPPESDSTSYGLALRWTAHQPANNLRSILRLNQATGWESFRLALADWSEPALNFVYADRHGHVGYALAGRIPRRPAGGSPVPAPGWTADAAWDGLLAAHELPALLDPPTGYVLSANSRIVGDEYPHHLSFEWINGYRARRISELIETSQQPDLDDFARWQMDLFCRPGLELAQLTWELLGALPGWSQREAAALRLLRDWDGQLTAESAAGALYEVLLGELQRAAFGELGTLLPGYLGQALNPLFGASATTIGRSTPLLLAALRQGQALPFGQAPTEVLGSALRRAVARLVRALGPDVARWRWGALHQVLLTHALGEAPLLGRLFNRGPYALGGDTDTVCQIAFHPAAGFAGLAFAAGYRQLCDPGDWDRSRSVLTGGQSGHPASPHYDDQLALWRAGALHPMLWSRERVVAMSRSRLLLVPGEPA